jgi:hypothetical protein
MVIGRRAAAGEFEGDYGKRFTRRDTRSWKTRSQWQVLQVFVAQDVQEAEALLRRLAPPPIPKDEQSFFTSALRHCGQVTPFSPPSRTSDSKW